MEQWKCKSKNQALHNPDSSLQNSKLNSSTLERKKEKKWTFGGLLKRISKNEATENSIIRETGENHQQQAVSNVIQREKNDYQEKIYFKNKKNKDQDFIQSYDLNINLNNKKNVSNNFQKNKKHRIKARFKAKRDQYCGNSSSDEQTESNNKKNNTMLQIQSEDSININYFKNENNKKTRAARTERYMKRLYREDIHEVNNHDSIKSTMTTDIQLCKNEKKSLSDTSSLSLWTKNDTLNQQSCVKLPSRYCQSYNSDQNLENVIPGKDVDAPIDLRNNELFYNDKYTWPQSRKVKITSIKQNKFSELDDTVNYQSNKDQPPTPPPRSSKSRILFPSIRFSLQNSDIENNEEQNNRLLQSFIKGNNGSYFNSLDRIPKRKNMSSYRKVDKLKAVPKILDIENNHPIEEDPIIPMIKPRLHSNTEGTQNISINKKLEHRRDSKNLEEALLELEAIYNSLRLSDENLLDRAEQRSMEEYRKRVTTTAIEGSIKSLSDTSSSYELSCRHANFDRCHDCDTRLKDDMAYRRMHQNDRPPSIDPSQSSLSRVSYLTTSPNLGHRNVDYLIDRSKSHRGTPDLIYDDVVFRNITHANNTLKVVDPQPPFGIPLGPVTAASESDYLHVEPSHEQESQSRSLFIPKSEPDVITDDLAFRSLRADRKNSTKDKTKVCSDFLSTSEFSTTPQKKRAVRSLSANLYGIIEKNSDNHSWYKKYIEFNKPSSFVRDAKSYGDDDNKDENTTIWIGKKFYDIDINGNRPKSVYQGRIQVCIPQEAGEVEKENDNLGIDHLEMGNNKHETPSSSCIQKNPTNYKSISAFTDQELSEYQQLCRDLECLIKKTSEKVKHMETKNNTDSRKNSLSEFIEWEKLLTENDSCLENKRVYEPSELRVTNKINIEKQNSKACQFSQSNSATWNPQENYLPTVEVKNDEKNNDVDESNINNYNSLDNHDDSCNNNSDSHSSNSNDSNLLCLNNDVLDQTLNTFNEINQTTDIVNNSSQISDEKKSCKDLEQINNGEVTSTFVKPHRASTSSIPEDHNALNNMINSTNNSEGRETIQ